MKLTLPKGKITIRHRQMRGVWQVFAGNTYLTGASDDLPSKAAQQLANQYDVPPGSTAFIHSGKNSSVIEIPESE